MHRKLYCAGFVVVCFIQADTCVSSTYQARYSLKHSHISLEANVDTWNPYTYILRNRRALQEEEKASISIRGSVDTKTLGEYEIHYNEDLQLQVEVVDTTAPIVVLQPMQITQNVSFSWNEQQYASIIKQLEDNVSSKEELMKQLSCDTIDTSLLGLKAIPCVVKDGSDNITLTELVVQVQRPPIVNQSNNIVTIPVASYSLSELREIQEVASLVNDIRTKNNVAPVHLDLAKYHDVTYLRSQEVHTLYSHTRPNGLACGTIYDEYALAYTSTGENIAQGQQSASEVVSDWMKSSLHRENILRTEFTSMSVGVYGSGDNKKWVLVFFS